MEKMLKLNTIAFYVLSISLFMSISLSSVYHILGGIVGLYFLASQSIKIKASSKFLLIFSLAIVFSTTSSFLSDSTSFKPLMKIKYFIIPILSIFPLFNFSNESNQDRPVRLYSMLILFSSIATLSGLFAYCFGYHPLRFKEVLHIERASGMFGMVMSYAHSVSFLCTILLGLLIKNLFKNEKKLKLYTMIALTISITGLIYSFTRGAWLGFLVSIPFLFLEKKNIKKFMIACLLTLLSTAAIYQIPIIKNTFKSRISSNNQRISFFKAAIEGFKENPILGLGYRRFEPNSKRLKKKLNLPYADRPGHAHNNYLEHLASLGSLGFISFMLFLFFWGFEIWQNFTPLNQVFFAFYINFLVSGLTQYTFGDGENLFFIMACYTITQVICLKNKKLIS